MGHLAIFLVVSLAVGCSEATGKGDGVVRAEESPREITRSTPCKKLGEECVDGESDCQCCRDNGYCHCSFFFNHCTCQVGGSVQSYSVCQRKLGCPNRYQWGSYGNKCTKPCLTKKCMGK